MSEDGYLSFLTGLGQSTSQNYLHNKLQSDIATAASENSTDWDGVKGEGLRAEPTYTLQGAWWVMWLVCLEYLALWWQKEPLPCLHDNVMSMVHATLYEITKVMMRGMEYGVYMWLWQNYAFLPPLGDSFLAVATLVVLVDLGYYWLHRANHEIMLLWAVHQIHHSSQDLTVAVGMRHSPLQQLFAWVFYLPLALLGVPPSHMLAHAQFNLLYQCWLHTDAVGSLGPLEYVFNTPTHHRIHHGSNKYCLDKNYGGVFIFWDHLFGTFQAPLQDTKTVYGILIQPETFNPISNQFHYFKAAIRKVKSMDSWRDSLVALCKGPSWRPGAPWTGWDKDKIDVCYPREYRKATAIPTTHIYVILHFLATLTLTCRLAAHAGDRQAAVLLYSGSVVAALTAAGMLYDQTWYTRGLEAVRCLGGLVLCVLVAPPAAAASLLPLLAALYALSLLVWLFMPSLVLCGQAVPITQPADAQHDKRHTE
ncbi:Alkylglycerol monooxygenase [Chionoecetes opilio]|uniref:Alkylglycerol monooxygenase n=1 Tax=Chionoecetes opilio TaxID=41210 RepID=A0A8J4YPF2_CHIOP|nr:Alkylglycerol monooxygenase [Chionoecetes opilio]